MSVNKVTSVSYTHLDVYKRQSIHSITGTEKGVKPGANPVLSQSIGYDLFNVFFTL